VDQGVDREEFLEVDQRAVRLRSLLLQALEREAVVL
jgi:hypothetical protein